MKFFTVASSMILAALAVVASPRNNDQPRKAVVVVSGNSTVTGTITFEQASASDQISIQADVRGLTPNKAQGWHVHEYGDLSGGCDSTGGHFNPTNETHGAPTDNIRHVGDLGNLQSDEQGNAFVQLQDREITLFGDNSVVGLGLVIHAGTDDLGRGGTPESLLNGNSGVRVACGVIGIAAPH